MPEQMLTAAVPDWRAILGTLLRHAISVATVLGVLWWVAKPHAEDFVRDTVAEEKFVTGFQLDVIERRVERMQNSVSGMNEKLEDQERQQESVNSDLRFLKALQTEQRQDIKQILRGVNRLED